MAKIKKATGYTLKDLRKLTRSAEKMYNEINKKYPKK